MASDRSHTQRIQRAEALARHVADRSARVLDAGVGTGMVGEELARLGFRHITALDLSPGILKTANEKSIYEELVVGELGKPLDFETGRFRRCDMHRHADHRPRSAGVAGRAGAGHKAWRDDRLLDADGLSYQGRVRRQAGRARGGRTLAVARAWRAVPADAARRAGHLVRDLGVRGAAPVLALRVRERQCSNWVRAARPFRTEWTSLLPYQGQRLVGGVSGAPFRPTISGPPTEKFVIRYVQAHRQRLELPARIAVPRITTPPATSRRWFHLLST